MRVVVHCGQPKTGTSTLQATLSGNREVLASWGVCYPSGVLQPWETHKWIAPLFLPESLWSAHLQFDADRRRSDAQVRARAERAWARMRAEIEEAQPDSVVISSETYLRAADQPSHERMRLLFGELSDDITYVLYVRDPAEHYQSSVRQMAKTRGLVRPPSPLRVRAFIEEARALGVNVIVRPYGRETLVGSSIVDDFLTSVLDRGGSAGELATVTVNESLSTEATMVLLEHRARVAPGREGSHEPRVYLARRILAEVDRQVPRSRPESLMPGLRDRIIRSSTELDWLREHEGITFPGIDYPVTSAAESSDLPDVQRLEDVCVADVDRLAEVRRLTEARLTPGRVLRSRLGLLASGHAGPDAFRTVVRSARETASRGRRR